MNNTYSPIDFDIGLKHAGNNASLYLRFLSQFPQDASFTSLKHALNQQEWEAAYLHAHTLKGLSAQLGLHTLSQSASALCELLREPVCEQLLQVAARMENLNHAYQETLEQIRAIL